MILLCTLMQVRTVALIRVRSVGLDKTREAGWRDSLVDRSIVRTANLEVVMYIDGTSATSDRTDPFNSRTSL
jgi:hypothetical protein